MLLALAMGSRVVMPGIMTRNAQRYGLVGSAFGLVTWPFSFAVAMIISAVLGAMLGERRMRIDAGSTRAGQAQHARSGTDPELAPGDG